MSKYLILIFQDEAAAQPPGDTVSVRYREFLASRSRALDGER